MPDVRKRGRGPEPVMFVCGCMHHFSPAAVVSLGLTVQVADFGLSIKIDPSDTHISNAFQVSD